MKTERFFYILIICILIGGMTYLFNKDTHQNIQPHESTTIEIQIPQTNITSDSYLGSEGKNIDNSEKKRQTFLNDVVCRISSGLVVKSEIVTSEITQCPHISRAHVVDISLKKDEKNFTVRGLIPQDDSFCDVEGSTLYAYYVPENMVQVGNTLYNLVVDKNFYILEIPPHEEKYDVDFISQLSLPECEPNVQ